MTAIATGDLDGDGDTDVVTHFQTGAIKVWRNEGETRNRSLRVALQGRVSNRSGVGANIEIRAGSLAAKVELVGIDDAGSGPLRCRFRTGNAERG